LREEQQRTVAGELDERLMECGARPRVGGGSSSDRRSSSIRRVNVSAARRGSVDASRRTAGGSIIAIA
jgi:hypothetical protein